MNTQPNLNNRLLKLFPVALVKEHYNQTGKQFDIIRNIVAQAQSSDIINFALTNMGSTKQHVYLYELNKGFSRQTFNTTADPFPLTIKKEGSINGATVFYCLPSVKFDVTIKDANGNYSNAAITFLQPLVLKLIGKRLIIHATILERDLSAYIQLPAGSRIVDSDRNVKDDFTSSILDYFNSLGYSFKPMDINKGLKHLTDHDIIDFRFIRFKRSRSTATETMDEQYTFKKEYPAEYSKVMNSPLDRSVFKYLLNDDAFCRHFTSDPSLGQISVTLYPDNPNQVSNVIDKILQHN